MLITAEGSLRFYGGEEVLLDKVVGAAGPAARVGLADGPFAARWAARTAENEPHVVEDTVGFLSRLDISAIDREEMIDTFRWLGLTTLGSLAELPRPAVASRFGEEGLRAHQLATGEGRSTPARFLLIWRSKLTMTIRSNPLTRWHFRLEPSRRD